MAPRPVAEGDGGAPRAAWRAPRHHARRRRRSSSSRSPPRRTPAASSGAGATRAAAIALDSAVKTRLRERGVEALSFNGRLMREPWEVAKPDGAPPAVFSAFWRRHRALPSLPVPSRAPDRLTPAPWPEGAPERVAIEALALTPVKPDWSGELALGETAGEAGALAALARFIDGPLAGYAEGRDLTSRETTSRLSAHLRFGEISTRRIAAAVESAAAARPALQRDAEKFMAELGWRDFATALLYRPSRHGDAPAATGVRALSLARRRGRFSRLGARANRLSDRRRRNASALAHRIHAQSRPHDRRLVPRKAPPHRLAARRAMVLGHAHRRRSGQQSDGLAMGRGVGRRRRPLFPHLQSGAAGGEVRPRRRLCAPLGP